MIYFTIEKQHFLVLEPGNIEKLKDGKVVHSPDNQVALCFTPDVLWLQEKLMPMFQSGSLDASEFDKAHKESMSRPEVKDRPYHETEFLGGSIIDGQNRKTN